MATNVNCKAKSGANKELTSEDIEVLKKRSTLDEKEIRRLHEEFWRTNPRGTMTESAYETFHHRTKKDSAIRKFPHELAFALFDTDQNEELDFVEFLMAHAFESSGNRREALGFLFDMCDYTRDGRMSMTELATFNKLITNSAKETQSASSYETLKVAGRIFSFIGLDAEKKLTKEEFITECEKIPLIKTMFKVKK